MTTLSHNDLVENIADVLREVDGDYLAKIYNQICTDKVVYVGDSLFEKEPGGRRETLEDVGYQFSGNGQTGQRTWRLVTDGDVREAGTSFSSDEDAVDHAWEDASQQTRIIEDISVDTWNAMSLAEQAKLITKSLSEG
jgi:hypothetical protein